MTRITFIHPDQSRTDVDVASGVSVMQAAVAGGVEGIVAECGGAAMCATCHVYVENDAFRARLPPIRDEEEEMLECTASPRTDSSRLSCQLVVTPEFEGLVLRVPDEQI